MRKRETDGRKKGKERFHYLLISGLIYQVPKVTTLPRKAKIII